MIKINAEIIIDEEKLNPDVFTDDIQGYCEGYGVELVVINYSKLKENEKVS